ncbi:polysaccharide deacetylase family protein [Hymenobacter humi]|uniref:Polysaccharide deacetylase family protein n=1 Tax=Hymenobacter humi TaxID=1411620 RepID=A0ABW2U483_9BACT
MYHALLAHPGPSPHAVHIAAQLFEQQMAWLHAHRYEAITVAELHRRLTDSELTPNTVVITFDDGYLSLLTQATPVLSKYGFAATLFLTTGFVGLPEFPASFAAAVPPGDRPLTWAEVREMHALGWNIQAHSCTHVPHAGLPAQQLRTELDESKRLIQSNLGADVAFYAFPYGSYDRHTLQALHHANYRAGFSVHSGQVTPYHDLKRLPRVEMNTSCSLEVFESLVRTGHVSSAAQYRAWVRDGVFYFPVVKDTLQKVFKSLVN